MSAIKRPAAKKTKWIDNPDEALRCLSPDGDRDEWFTRLAAYKDAGGTFEGAKSWSQLSDKYDGANFPATWDSIKPGAVKAATLYFQAKERKYRPRPVEDAPATPARAMTSPAAPAPTPGATSNPAGGLLPVGLTVLPPGGIEPKKPGTMDYQNITVYLYRNAAGELVKAQVRIPITYTDAERARAEEEGSELKNKTFRKFYAACPDADTAPLTWEGLQLRRCWAEGEKNLRAGDFAFDLGYGKGRRPDPLYRENDLAAMAPDAVLYCVEGEKDADNLAALGYNVTCHKAAGGAIADPEKWRPFAATGRRVVIVQDNDATGKDYASKAAAAMREAGARVRVVTPPGVPEHGDFSDWLEELRRREPTLSPADVRKRIEAWEPEPPRIIGNSTGDILKKVQAEGPEDPNELIQHRFLCRGGVCLFAAETGVGKSSLTNQLAHYFALGLPTLGFVPKRPLRTLIIQAENDERDIAEELSGITTLMDQKSHLADSDIAAALNKVTIVSDCYKTGGEFSTWLEEQLTTCEEKPDLVFLDPLFAFAGGDTKQSADMSQFLRECINPVIRKHNVGLCIVHHVNKPKNDQRAGNQASAITYNYSGSIEIINMARASFILEADPAAGKGCFILRAGKRGQRLNWNEKRVKWGDDGIYWEENRDPLPERLDKAAQDKRKREENESIMADRARAVAELLLPGEALTQTLLQSRMTGKGFPGTTKTQLAIIQKGIDLGLIIQRPPDPEKGEGGRGISTVLARAPEPTTTDPL